MVDSLARFFGKNDFLTGRRRELDKTITALCSIKPKAAYAVYKRSYHRTNLLAAIHAPPYPFFKPHSFTRRRLRFFWPGRDGNPASLDADCFFILMPFFLQRSFSYLPAPCWVFLALLWMGASGPIKAEPPFRLFCIIFQMIPFVFSSNHFIAGNLPL